MKVSLGSGLHVGLIIGVGLGPLEGFGLLGGGTTRGIGLIGLTSSDGHGKEGEKTATGPGG